jgi:hypothetical protein
MMWTKSDFLKIIIRLSTRFNLDGSCKYVLQLCTSFLIKSYLFTSAFNMSDSETNLLKSALGISSSLLYLPLVSGDNNFICRSSACQMPWQWSDTLTLSIEQYNVIFYWRLEKTVFFCFCETGTNGISCD